MQDNALLTQYAQNNSEAAFSQLLARHLPLVYRTCRRELGSEPLAEDAAQVVFLLLARKAKTLRAGPSLAGWLYQTSVFVAKDIRKQEARRTRREQAVMQETVHAQAASASEWNTVEPHLNAALSALKPADRDAVLLRFLEGHTLAETGALLGVSEDAVRMRCARALEKLRRYLTTHGAAVTGVVLAALLTAEAARPVSAQAASAVTQGTLQALANSPAPNVLLLSKGVLHTMKIIKIKYATLAASLALAGASFPLLVHAFSPHKASVKVLVTPTPLAENVTTKFVLDKDQHAYYSLDLPKGDFLVVLDSRRADGKSGDGKLASLKGQLNFHNADIPLPSPINTTGLSGVQFSSSDDEERIINHRSRNTAMPLIIDIENDGPRSNYWLTVLPAAANDTSEVSPALAVPLFGEVTPPTISVGAVMTGQLKQNKSAYFLIDLKAGQYQSILNFSSTNRKIADLNGVITRSAESGNDGFGVPINNLHWNSSAQYRNVSMFTVYPGGSNAAPSGLSLIKVYNQGSATDAAPVHFTARILPADSAETR